jgi:hypothetical protein
MHQGVHWWFPSRLSLCLTSLLKRARLYFSNRLYQSWLSRLRAYVGAGQELVLFLSRIFLLVENTYKNPYSLKAVNKKAHVFERACIVS